MYKIVFLAVVSGASIIILKNFKIYCINTFFRCGPCAGFSFIVAIFMINLLRPYFIFYKFFVFPGILGRL